MLAAIGVIIIAKQVPVAVGVDNRGEPLELLASIPEKIMHLNPEIAVIGGISLLILFGLPLLKNRTLRKVPAPMLVVLVAVPLGLYFDLAHEHTYTFGGHDYQVGDNFLVPVPDNLFAALTFPDFSGLATATGWKWVIMFALIGSLESVLSAKAVDTLDPLRRKTNPDRDLLAVGSCNVLAALVGGLPMISEIVRSKANIDNGARTSKANVFHGLFLLLFVASVPALIHRIPLAALGAMLVYTGFRLASPREFVNAYKEGREQLIVFVTTLVAVLATDLLIGVAIGVVLNILIQIYNVVPLWALFRPEIDVTSPDGESYHMRVKYVAVFSNWIAIVRSMSRLSPDRDLTIDLSGTVLVDHTVMEKLHELEREFAQRGRKLVVIGLEEHEPQSSHPRAARRRLPYHAPAGRIG
jgi:MFS superfamily sulfate permease-like transporter